MRDFIFFRSFEIVQFQIFVHKFKNMFLFSHFWKYVCVFKFCLGISRNVPVSKQIPWFSKIFSFKFLFCKLAIYLCFIDPFVFSIKNDFEKKSWIFKKFVKIEKSLQIRNKKGSWIWKRFTGLEKTMNLKNPNTV